MKLITKNSQIVSGMTVILHKKEDREYFLLQAVVDRLKEISVVLDNGEIYLLPEDKDSGYYYELVSYPPRRPVTWEWVKENIDQVPGLEFWYDNVKGSEKRKIQMVGRTCFKDTLSDGWNYATHHAIAFIDPPHPEVPDVPAPCDVKSKPAEEKKSLWWFADADRIILGGRWLTYSEAKVEYKSYDRIQPVTRPVHERPDENAWMSV